MVAIGRLAWYRIKNLYTVYRNLYYVIYYCNIITTNMVLFNLSVLFLYRINRPLKKYLVIKKISNYNNFGLVI